MGFEYTVNGNDKGLSYIFLDQAKKLDGFDESKQIDWNQVMTVFDEIQQEKKAEQGSLFEGETDKTKKGYGTSYKIKKDDKIELTDAQLNKIYEAMGVDLNKAHRTTSATDPNPPQKGENLSKKTASLDNLEKASRSDVQDGETLVDNRIYTYQNGVVVSSRDKNNKTSRMILRDNNGNITEFNDYENDKNGNPVKMYIYDKNGKIKEYREFVNGSNGKPTRTISRNTDGTIKDYTDWKSDSSGNTTSQVERNSTGSVTSIYEYQYDSSGRMTKKIEKDVNGNTKFYTIYSEWDSKTKDPIKGQKYDANGLLYNG